MLELQNEREFGLKEIESKDEKDTGHLNILATTDYSRLSFRIGLSSLGMGWPPGGPVRWEREKALYYGCTHPGCPELSP